MLVEQVSKLPTRERLLYWIRERYQIYLRKRVGKPKPWTDDTILQRYRFCNVRRVDDTVSQWLIKKWYAPHLNHPNIILACTLARNLNNPDALQAVGFPTEWHPKMVESILDARQALGQQNYRAAYMITSRYGRNREPETKVYQTVWRVCDFLYRNPPVIDTDSMERTWKALLEMNGLGSFMAGQVVADLRWVVDGQWLDKDTWAPIGFGSMRGLNRYYGRPLNHSLNGYSMGNQKFLPEFKTLWEQVRKMDHLPHMEAMDFQSCLCEWDKYERVRLGEGRPRKRYAGV